MVLLLRAPFVDPNPIEAALDKFVEKFTASMKTWSHEFVKTIKQPQPKSDTKHDRKVLICGYMEEEECFCVATEITESEYDLDDAVVEFEEKKGYQNHLQIQQDDNPIVFEFGDNEGFQTKIEGPNPLIHQLPDQLIHGKVNSFSQSDFSSPNLSTNTAVGMICANKKGYHVAYKVFDKKLELGTTNHQNEI